MSRANNVLFYSERCPFSLQVIELIKHRGFQEYFVFVCVDHQRNRAMMPKQVDRVPALLLREERRLLFEDDIVRYIGVPEREPAPAVVEPEVMPLEQPVSAYSDNFSFLDDSMQGEAAAKNFALFGQEQHIQTVSEEDGGGKIDTSSVLDRYMSQRAHDVTSIWGDKKIVS